MQHRIREPLNLAGTAEDPLQFEIVHSSRHTQSEVTGVGKFCGCSLNASHCRPGTTNPGLLECPWLGRSRELVQFLDAGSHAWTASLVFTFGQTFYTTSWTRCHEVGVMPASRCAPTGKVQPVLPALLISDVDTDAMAQFMSLV